MPVRNELEALLPELSKSERKAAEYLLRYPHDIKRFSADSIARSSGTSRSAIIRLCQKLGYQGFAEFKFAASQESVRPLPSAEAEASACVLDHYIAAIEQMRAFAGSDRLDRMADVLLHASHILALGYLHSNYAAKQFAFRLNRMGIDCHPIGDNSLMESYTSILKPGDAVVIFSLTGLAMYRPIMEEFRRNRIKLILITMNRETPIARLADETVVLPQVSHDASPYLLDDGPTFYLFIELLIEAMNQNL